MKGWLIGVLAIALLLSVLFPRQREGDGDGAALRAAQHTADSMRVAHAQDFARYKRSNDSLKQRLAALPTKVVIRNDTALVPITVYRDIVQRCSECAARTDTIFVQDSAQKQAADKFASMLQGELAILRKRAQLGPRFQSYVEVARSLVVGELRVAADADLRLFGRVRAFARAEHTFGYPPRSDLLAGVRAYP